MKIKGIILLGAAVLCSVPSQATEALQDIKTYSQTGLQYDEVGFSFLTATNITVTNLGYRFKSNAIASSYVVRLLDANGGQLAAATLNAPAGNTNQLVYTNIDSVALVAGSTNYLVAYDALEFATNNGTKFWENYIIDVGDSNSGSFTVASALVYLGATLSTNLLAGSNSTNYLFVGPNFKFTTELVVSYLTIRLTPSNTVQLLWPESDTVGQLQTAPDLSQAMTNVANPPVIVGTNKVVELPLHTNALFRLDYGPSL